MAEFDELVPALAVLAIVLGVHAFNVLQTRRPAPAPATGPATPLGSAPMLGRYATHRGSVVGEVVALTTDRVVLRQAGVHKAVPLAQARMREGDVLIEGDVDWTAAEDAGKAWDLSQREAEKDDGKDEGKGGAP